MVGIAKPSVNLSLPLLLGKEIHMKGVIFYGNDYKEALQLIIDKKVDLLKVVSHKHPPHRAQEALEWCFKGVDPEGKAAVKVMFDFDLSKDKI